MNSKRIVLLVGRAESSNIVYNALKHDFDIIRVVEEEPVSRKEFLKRRLKKLGILKVAGQLMFRIVIISFLALISGKRMATIRRESNLDGSAIPESILVRVPSVNNPRTREVLKEVQPDVIVVNGTRIITAEVLQATQAPFVNMHAGITPLYRGVHGGYWAMVNQDRANCGVTIHLVDRGIDTGGILAQASIDPTAEDNFLTYTYLQLAGGIPRLKVVLYELVAGRARVQSAPLGTSRLWTHPTIWEYLRHRFVKGVK
jgi:methionyl-tRNA formyltransferase